jgi:3-dehydroquinate dehydratase type I
MDTTFGYGRLVTMKPVRFGKLSIGDTPRVVATLASLDAMVRFRNAKLRPCDVAEVRLDLIGPNMDWMPLARTIRESGTPIILTLRAAYEGGKWTGSDAERMDILSNAAASASAIDVELKSGLAAKLKQNVALASTPLIVSFHDFARTPPLAELTARMEQALEQGDVAKISTMVQTEADLDTLRALLAKPWSAPVCVIGMGGKGEITRTEFPRAGSCLTYGYFETPVAPGQLSAEALMAHLGRPVTTP